jgi:acyl dehydratase
MALLTMDVRDVPSLAGRSLGTTAWREVTQSVIDLFAEATGDRQWIHIDPQRAAKESPFRKTIAHGYFTLSLVPVFFWELLEVTGSRLAINYGANKVRWPAPVPIPCRVRMSAKIASVEAFESGFTLTMDATIEVEGQQKPAMVAEVVFRYYSMPNRQRRAC